MNGLSAASPQPVLVKNIREGAVQADFSPQMQVALGDKALFIGNDGVHGEELWISDGSAAGTRLVKDIWPGPNSAVITGVTVAGNRAFFSATDGVHGQELWVTDGTEAGTSLAADIVAGEADGSPVQLAAYGSGVIFLSSPAPATLISAWYSDGTAAGTRKIGESVATSRPSGLRTCSDGTRAWVFLPDNAYPREELYRVQGSGATVSLVKVRSLDLNASISPLGVEGNNLLFQVFTPVPQSGGLYYNAALWKNEANNTFKIKDIRQVTHPAISTQPEQMVVTPNKTYFISRNGGLNPSQLWVTDGTPNGTLVNHAPSSSLGSPVELTLFGSKLIITGDTGIGSLDPQTQALEVLLTGHSQSPIQALRHVTRLGHRLLFRGMLRQGASTYPVRFWTSDGTAAGTQYILETFSPPSEVSFALPSGALTAAVVIGNTALFAGGIEGNTELWKTNGTEGGTLQVTDIQRPDASSSPEDLRSLSGLLYFTADDGVHGRELWRSDGTEAGTFLLKDIREGTASSSPANLVEMNGHVYFVASTPELGSELWRTDGTSAGTQLVSDLSPGADSGVSGRPVLFKNRLYFPGPSTVSGPFIRSKLWSTDGTAEGTQVYAAADQENASYPQSLTVMDGWLYFIAADTTASNLKQVLLRTNGVSGTLEAANNRAFPLPLYLTRMLVRPPTPGAAVAPDKHVLFMASDTDLWRCCNGELAVKVHSPTVSTDTINDIQLHGDGVLLVRNPGYHTNNLWRSDGTTAGTGRWGPAGWIRLQHRTDTLLYYSQVVARDEWRTSFYHRKLNCMNLDGSGGQEILPAQILSGSADSTDIRLSTVHTEGETVFFGRSINDSLWALGSTHGTPESTRMFTRLSPTTVKAPGNPFSVGGPWVGYAFQKLGNRLYFSANNGPLGDELYSLDLGGHLEVKELQGEGESETETRELASGATLTFPLEAIGQQAPLQTVLLRNTGSQPLTGITVSLPSGSDFEASTIADGTLEPGETAVFTISFTPKAGGQRQDTLQITAMGSAAITHTLSLTGTALGMDEAPLLRASPLPGLALAGQPFTLAPDILTSAPFTGISWKRDGVHVPPSIDHHDQPTTLVLSSVKLTDAGVYILTAVTAAGSVTTVPAPMGVITSAPEAVSVNEWGALTLTCLAKAPKGYLLNYEWRRNGDALTDSQILKGSRSAVLKIAYMELVDAGEYDCLVTLATTAGPVMDGAVPVSRSAGLTNVAVNARPRVLAPAEPLSWVIGETVSYQLTTDIPAASFTARGLPPGLKMSKTGLITGKPTRSFNSAEDGSFLPYYANLTATNAAGIGPAELLPMYIRAFMPAGGYDCLLDPIDGLTHGSHLKFTVTSTGAFSGQLLHGGKMFRFTSRQLDAAAIPGRHFQVNLSTQTMPLMLMLIAPETEGQACVATLTQGEEGVLGQLQADCRRHLFSSTLPATALAGAYTWSMIAPGSEQLPTGAGFMTATVAKTGIVNWKGRLADGTAVTGSNALSAFPGGGVDLPVHADLYKLKGALHGAAVFGVGETSVTLSGSFFWDKDALPEASKEGNYKAGFARHEVGIEGSRYQAPAAGEYLFGIVRGDLNAQVDVSGGDMGVTQGIELSVKHTVSLSAPTLSNGLFLKSLSFSVKTGTFKGSVLLLHESDPKLNRTATFEGLILSHEKVGRGFMLLRELPAEGQPASAIKTTPLRSVTVMVSAM